MCLIGFSINDACTSASDWSKDELTFQDIIDTVNKLRDWPPYTGPYHFWTAGTGIPDEMAIEYWKDTNIIVVARDGKEYYHGKLLEDV